MFVGSFSFFLFFFGLWIDNAAQTPYTARSIACSEVLRDRARRSEIKRQREREMKNNCQIIMQRRKNRSGAWSIHKMMMKKMMVIDRAHRTQKSHN